MFYVIDNNIIINQHIHITKVKSFILPQRWDVNIRYRYSVSNSESCHRVSAHHRTARMSPVTQSAVGVNEWMTNSEGGGSKHAADDDGTQHNRTGIVDHRGRQPVTPLLFSFWLIQQAQQGNWSGGVDLRLFLSTDNNQQVCVVSEVKSPSSVFSTVDVIGFQDSSVFVCILLNWD